jgi:hypothetical protein
MTVRASRSERGSKDWGRRRPLQEKADRAGRTSRGTLADLVAFPSPGIRRPSGPSTDPDPGAASAVLEDVLLNLSATAETAAAVEEALATWVKVARTQGATWAQVGVALGVTRQSAWQRFSGQE